MSACVETMFYVGATPWHGEGNKIEGDKKLNISEGITSAGLDWNVSIQPLVTTKRAQELIDYTHGSLPDDYDPPTIEPDVDHNAVVRSNDNRVLGVVGPRYTPLQNIKAFEWFQPFLDAKTCSLHTAGSLYGGKKIWVLAELNNKPTEIVKGDEIAKFIMLSNSHDGTTSVRVGFTPIRVVCANTLAMAHNNNNSKLLRLRHSSQLIKNLDEVRDIMNLANQEFETTAEKYKWLATRHINTKDLIKYVKVILDVDLNKTDTELPTRTQNTINKVVELCLTGRGNNTPQTVGTYWAAYNGVTEYLNHIQGRNVSNRLDTLWFGVNAAKNKKALDLALEMAV